MFAAVTALLVAGCSGGGGDKGSTLTIAAVGPLTGSSKARGQDLQQAAKLAVDEINERGGVGREKIDLSVYDDVDDPEQGGAVAQKVAASSALAVLGGVASSAAYAEGQVYRQAGIPAITGQRRRPA
jgi:branched-chain amino acid transport system substrate-binding protein